MRGRVAIAGLVLAVGVALGFFLRPGPGPVTVTDPPRPPAVVTAPDAAVVIAIAAHPNGAPPLPTVIDVKEPVGWDAGTTVEVTLELFDEKGHIAGATVVLKNPPCLPDGGTGAGAVEVEARSNVMGFARVALVPGTWEVESFRSSPPRIEVGFGPNAFVLKKADWVPAPVEGLVLDGQSKPVERAKVMVQGAPAGRPRTHDPPIPATVAETDAQGRFALQTFGPGLTIVAAEGARMSPPVYVPAGTKSAQLILADLPR